MASAAAVDSSFDVAYWFIDQALDHNEYLQPQKLHRLMYLAQAYFAVAYNGRMLMPALFVADEFGPIEPNVFRACSVQRPAIEPRPLPEPVTLLLDSIWRRFGPHSSEHLNKQIGQHAPFRQALAKGPRSEITLASMIEFYGKKAAPSSSSSASVSGAPPITEVLRPRLMRSQTGQPVAVQKWMPPAKATGK